MYIAVYCGTMVVGAKSSCQSRSSLLPKVQIFSSYIAFSGDGPTLRQRRCQKQLDRDRARLIDPN